MALATFTSTNVKWSLTVYVKFSLETRQ